MKIIVVLNRRWSRSMFLRFIPHIRSFGFDVPTHVVALAPADERMLRVLCPDDVCGYVSFPIEAVDIANDSREV